MAMERRGEVKLRAWVWLGERKGRGMLEGAVGGIGSILGILDRLMIKTSRDGWGANASCDICLS